MAWHYWVSYVTLALYIVQMKPSGVHLVLKYKRMEIKNMMQNMWTHTAAILLDLWKTFCDNEGYGTEWKRTCDRAPTVLLELKLGNREHKHVN